MAKVRKGIYYFDSYETARSYATQHAWPPHRIVHYITGWAIQLHKSGPYVGPNSEAEHARLHTKAQHNEPLSAMLWRF